MRSTLSFLVCFFLLFSILHTSFNFTNENKNNPALTLWRQLARPKAATFIETISIHTIFGKFLPFLDFKSSKIMYYFLFKEFKKTKVIDEHYQSKKIYDTDQNLHIVTYFGQGDDLKIFISDLQRKYFKQGMAVEYNKSEIPDCYVIFKSNKILPLFKDFYEYDKIQYEFYGGFEEQSRYFFMGRKIDEKLENLAEGFHLRVRDKNCIRSVFEAQIHFNSLQKIFYTSYSKGYGQQVLTFLDSKYAMETDNVLKIVLGLYIPTFVWFVITNILNFPTIQSLSLLLPNNAFVLFMEKCISFNLFPQLLLFIFLFCNPEPGVCTKCAFGKDKESFLIEQRKLRPSYLKYTIPLMEQRKKIQLGTSTLVRDNFLTIYFASFLLSVQTSLPIFIMLFFYYFWITPVFTAIFGVKKNIGGLSF